MTGTPDTIGHYRIVRRLGAGGMDEVFLAPDALQIAEAVADALSAAHARGIVHPQMPQHSVYTESVFEWDPRKAEANAAKHGVSFDEAVTIFLDTNARDGPDLQHSTAEQRYLRLGRAADGRVLMVAYTLRRSGDAETIRIISARRASRRERAAYGAKD